MKTDRLLIYGASIIAEVAYEYFSHDSPYEVSAFVLEEAFRDKSEFMGLPVLPFETVAQTCPPSEYSMFIAVGSLELNYARERLCSQARAMGYTLASYISSSAQVWPNVALGDNCFILPMSIVQPFTKLGNGVTIWDGSMVGHHCTVGDYVFMASSKICGLCTVGRHSFLGAGAVVGDGVSIAEDNYLALGAVVHKNTKANSIYRGNPAKRQEIETRVFCGVKEA